MKLRNKKGFTIIELVIVIAVIGVLTAVLVPTFINLTNRANEAADDSLVKNLNTALKMEEQLPGNKKNQTLQDAVDDLEAEGYLLENLVSKSGKDLLWNQSTNEFVLNKESSFSGKDYWKIVNEVPAYDQQKYSYYAGKNFKTEVPNLKYGFDSGKIEGIPSLNYVGLESGAQEVNIRTNSYLTTLVVDAPNDIVHHFDKVGNVNIISTNTASYHENGDVPFIEIKGGHIVLENTCNVKAIHFNATENTFTNEDGKNISIDMSKIVEDKKPSFSRDEVAIAGQGTYVAKVTNARDEYIWLWGNGTQTEMVVTTSPEEIAEPDGGSGYQLKPGVVAGTEDGTVADQIANNAVVRVNPDTGEPVIEYEVKTTKEEAKSVVEEAVSEEVAEKAEEESFDYAVRIGSKGYDTLGEALTDAASGDTITLLKDIDVTSTLGLNKNITINLGGKTINSSATLFNIFSNYNLVIKDTAETGVINVNGDRGIYSSGGGLVRIEGGTLKVSSTNNHVYGVLISSGSSFEMTGGAIVIPATSTGTYNYCVSNSGSGTVTIYGGELIARGSGGNYTLASSSSSAKTYIFDGKIEAYAYPAGFKSPYVLYITSGNTYVYGGYFRAIGDGATYSYGHLIDGSGTTTVYGGYFGGNAYYGIADNTGHGEHIADGYVVITNTDPETKTSYKFVVVKEA